MTGQHTTGQHTTGQHTTASQGSTATAVSPDSGRVWTDEGAWRVADGIVRIPLPLPMDGLRAVNVYVLTAPDGLTLIDGGWAIPAGREVLERSLRLLGAGLTDIRRILVTHVHRDHYTLAAVIGNEVGAQVALGAGERPVLDLAHRGRDGVMAAFRHALDRTGAHPLAEAWATFEGERPDPAWWRDPDRWLYDGDEIAVGARVLRTIHTPGHTAGHVVFADSGDGMLFTGDHLLPTITPSIGFTEPASSEPLADFLASLQLVRGLPDMQMLPAHGPVGMSTHARADALLAHHEQRLSLTLAALDAAHSSAFEVATRLTWTRHQRHFDELRTFDQVLATRETQAHLAVLVARGHATAVTGDDGVVRFRPVAAR